MNRILWFLLKDERGIDPMTLALIGGGLMAGGTAIGAFSKPKQNTIDPFGELRRPLINYSLGKIGKSTPYQYNPEFEIPKPEIESASEGRLMGAINEPRTAKQYSSDITDKYYKARKARLAESFNEERDETANMYNRLGLVSSSPGFQAQTDIGERQRLAEDEISSGLMYEDIDRELEGTRQADAYNMANLGLGLNLGGAQRGYGQFGIQESMADIERKTQEEQAYANMIASLLIGSPPQTYFKPSTGQQIGQGLTNIGSLGLMAGLGGFGGAAGGAAGSPTNARLIGATGRGGTLGMYGL